MPTQEKPPSYTRIAVIQSCHLGYQHKIPPFLTHEVQDKSTYQLINLPTYQLKNTSTHQLQPNRIAFGKLLPTASKTRIAWHQDTLTQGQRNTLVCLRCIYGFPNPILFDYKTTYKLINSSTYNLKNILQNTFYSPPPSRKI